MIALLSLSAAFAQGRGGSTKTWTPPRTPWGDPDLTGIWNNATSTPLQRPGQVESKQVLTDEEAADFERKRQQEQDKDNREATARGNINGAPTTADVAIAATEVLSPTSTVLTTNTGWMRSDCRSPRTGERR